MCVLFLELIAVLHPSQSAACGVDPTHYTHVVVEDSPDYIRWVRAILRSTNIPSASIDKYFSLDSSFKKGDSALGTPAVTASIIESVYAADYALIASDKATATPPPEPETTLPPVPPKEAPDLFCVAMESTSGTFTMEMHKEWSPNGVQVQGFGSEGLVVGIFSCGTVCE
jgi:hypothetical protein